MVAAQVNYHVAQLVELAYRGRWGMAVLQFGSRSFSFDFVVAVVIVVFYFFPLGFYFRVRLMFLQRLPCFL